MNFTRHLDILKTTVDYARKWEQEQDRYMKKTIDGHEWTFVEAKSKPTDNDNYYLEGVYIIEHKDNIYKFKYTNYTPEYNSGNKLIEKIVNSFKLG